ncbi:MAG: hypothetical protein HY606_04060, partial [Planctomycetes bacterium]|nr:hypothetical protein [Planctomycetota bacterium]
MQKNADEESFAISVGFALFTSDSREIYQESKMKIILSALMLFVQGESKESGQSIEVELRECMRFISNLGEFVPYVVTVKNRQKVKRVVDISILEGRDGNILVSIPEVALGEESQKKIFVYEPFQSYFYNTRYVVLAENGREVLARTAALNTGLVYVI